MYQIAPHFVVLIMLYFLTITLRHLFTYLFEFFSEKLLFWQKLWQISCYLVENPPDNEKKESSTCLPYENFLPKIRTPLTEQQLIDILREDNNRPYPFAPIGYDPARAEILGGLGVVSELSSVENIPSYTPDDILRFRTQKNDFPYANISSEQILSGHDFRRDQQ